MSDRTLRFLVAAVISLLLIHQIGAWIAGLLGAAWGVVSSVLVAAVSLFSARLARAGGRSSFWFLVPTIAFTLAPLAVTLWNAFTSDTGWLQRLAGMTPAIVGFGLPLALLFVVYYELRRRTSRGEGTP